jgi:DNA-binding GntR family transcriptional regulator
MEEPKLSTIRAKSLSEQAAQKIGQAIASGRFEPGTRLVESELAKELGLSRSPIREAFFLLEQEGLIVRYPRRGAFVRGLSRRETEEVYSLRMVLEGFAVERALKNMTPEKADHLRSFVQKMHEIVKTGDAVAFSQIDVEFHEYICKISEHRVLQHVFSTLHTRTLQYMTEASQLGVLASITQDHEDLLRHILGGDSEDAVEAMQLHVLASADRLLRGYPEDSTQDQAPDEGK